MGARCKRVQCHHATMQCPYCAPASLERRQVCPRAKAVGEGAALDGVVPWGGGAKAEEQL